jgi:hypothetical protein
VMCTKAQKSPGLRVSAKVLSLNGVCVKSWNIIIYAMGRLTQTIRQKIPWMYEVVMFQR